MSNIAATRENVDMLFKKKKLDEHLAHARKNGSAMNGTLSKYKWQVVQAPSDMDAWIFWSRRWSLHQRYNMNTKQ